MTATQKHDIIPICTTVLSADQPPKEDIMLDQQKITILYCRLSNEDAQEGESNSIANQREYLTRYARDHGYTNLKILVDDGYTGTNFNRPGVQEGFELVKQGLVGCWLVKDLSRFGRDYLTVGQYTDIIFPSYDVRFIAINDGVDSNRGDSEGFAAIRNLFNEWYPRDTSKKVRVSLRQRGTSGKHMGKPPYGYRCDPEDKDHWILDEEAAPVVKLIFDLCIDGKGPEQIARILEEKQIMTAKALYAKRKKKPMPEKRNGRDCSPGFCFVPIAAASSTLPQAKALRASRITTSATTTRATVVLVLPTISGKMCFVKSFWNASGQSMSISEAMWTVFRRNGCNAAGLTRSAASGMTKRSWNRQRNALPIWMSSSPGCTRTMFLEISIRTDTERCLRTMKRSRNG